MVNKPLLIAEAGISHMGRPELAGELCVEAQEAGADAVKFQLFTSFSRPFGKEFILKDTVWGGIVNRYSVPDFKVFFSVFDFESLELAKDISTWIKLSFISKQNKTLIDKVNRANFERKFISLDLYGQYEKEALRDWEKLYCPNTGWKASYPTPLEEIEFKRYGHANRLNYGLGYSCHGKDFRNCLIAASLGAPVIEKHFKLEEDDYSPDEACSITPTEFKEMKEIINLMPDLSGEEAKRVFPEI